MTWTSVDFPPGEFALTRKRPAAQTGLMTKKKMTALIREGYGQGHFHRYKPWLRVTKKDYSPNSTVGHLPAVAMARTHHFRSRAERTTIQVAKWLGALDVREAYPMWPWPHRHPGYGLPGFDDAPDVVGLMEIAREAGIDHGVFPGTTLPYVATIDELTTWRNSNGSYFLVAFENKPYETINEPKLISRAKERLELGARYCAKAGIRHQIIHAEQLPRELATNLDFLEPRLTEPAREALRQSAAYAQVVQALCKHGTSASPLELLEKVAREYTQQRTSAALHLALWSQDVDHDLSQPLRLWEPLIPGGRALKQALYSAWVGGAV